MKRASSAGGSKIAENGLSSECQSKGLALHKAPFALFAPPATIVPPSNMDGRAAGQAPLCVDFTAAMFGEAHRTQHTRHSFLRWLHGQGLRMLVQLYIGHRPVKAIKRLDGVSWRHGSMDESTEFW